MKKHITVFLALLLSVIISTSANASTPNGVEANSEEGENKMVRLYPFLAKSDKWGYMNENGEVIIKPQFGFADNFYEGRARVRSNDKDRKWGYIDEKGELVVPYKYDTTSLFKNGHAVVRVLDIPGTTANTATTFWINPDGKYFLKTLDDFGNHFYEGLARVTPISYPIDSIGSGFINKKGEFEFPIQYIDVGDYSEGLAAADTGKSLSEKLDDGSSESFDKGTWGYIDKTGKMAISAKYNRAKNFIDGLAPVAIGEIIYENGIEITSMGEYGFINKTGEMVIPAQYEDAYSFQEGLARIKKDGNWGFIDKTGKTVIPVIYANAREFSEGLAAVAVREYGYNEKGYRSFLGKWGFVDKTGKVVIEPQYEQVDDCINGLIAVRSSVTNRENYEFGNYELLYYIDKNGNKIVPQI